MSDRKRVLSTVFVLAAAAAACGSGTDAGGDGGGTDSAGSETQGADDSSGAADGAETEPDGSGTGGGVLDGYCGQAEAFLERCGSSLDMCTQARLRDCDGVAVLERDEFVAARQACGFPDECGELGAFSEQLCIYEATQAVAPTVSQEALADDLCAACLPDDAACVANFWVRPPPEEGSAVAGGIGTSFLHLSEAVVSELASTCVPTTGDASCLQSFYTCLADQLEALQPAAVTDACLLDGPE